MNFIELDVWIENKRTDDFIDIVMDNNDVKYDGFEIIEQRKNEARYSIDFRCYQETLDVEWLGNFYQIKNEFINDNVE